MKASTLTLAILSLVASLLISGCAKNENLDIEGTWRINPDKTMTLALDEGLISEDQIGGMLQRLMDRIQRSTMTVSKDKVVTADYEADYEVTYESKAEVVARLELVGEPVTLTFTDIDGVNIHIRSSATNDMDYLVWTKDTQ